MSRIVALGLALVCALYLCAGASPDSVSAWNSLCGKYHFDSYPATAQNPTFGGNYSGANYWQDMTMISSAMTNILCSPSIPPILDPDDIMNSSIENWDSL